MKKGIDDTIGIDYKTNNFEQEKMPKNGIVETI